MSSIIIWIKSLVTSQLSGVPHWKVILFGCLLGWGVILHFQNVHLKELAVNSEQRAQQAERTLSLVVKSQKIVEEEEKRLEVRKGVNKNDNENTKRAIHSNVQPSDADAMLLRDYANKINNRNTEHSK